ncbi:MAG: hypothetical protein J5U17_05040 [Candidatus Methanoperedens sp.]|nr:hypothetical protein [Candidatus Methanoperedens sp.]MCE8425124.1 hypothetical protein [Candidatus Methanoperedens sp.]MCE8428307.1 hypothetical protein [Candidatus Methanoperedens sp.]
MAKQTATKSTNSSTSSWWSERSKIISAKAPAKTTEPKGKRVTKKAKKAEKDSTYYCEICGAEMMCVEDSAGEVSCCGEPMCLVCG